MTDLLWQLWFTLLTAFGFGALFGWLLKSWRAHALQIAIRDGAARCAGLQAENGKQRDELKETRDRLRTQDADLQALRAAAAAAQVHPAEHTADEAGPAATAALAQLSAQLAASQARVAELEAQRAEGAAALAVRLGESAALKVELERLGDQLREAQRARSALQADSHELQTLRAQLEQARQTMAELTVAAQAAAAGPAQPLVIAPVSPDDLQQIRGVGPKIARLLHQLDVHSFRQIALASAAELDRLATALPGFASRIRREDWPGQCARLHLQKYGVAP